MFKKRYFKKCNFEILKTEMSKVNCFIQCGENSERINYIDVFCFEEPCTEEKIIDGIIESHDSNSITQKTKTEFEQLKEVVDLLLIERLS